MCSSDLDYRLHKLGQYVRGWTAYFGISQYYRPVPELFEQDQAANPHVSLETVALGAHEDQESAGLGREPEDGDPAWRQQQELLAHGANPGAAAGTVQRVVESARAGQRERPVVKSPGLHELKDKKNFVERADLLNRPLRTRTVGGVGAGS